MEMMTAKRPLTDDHQPHESPLNLKGTQFLPTPALTNDSGSTSTLADKASPPAPPSESELSSIQDVSSIAPQDMQVINGSKPTSDAPRPAKRRKLTHAEKLEQEKLKEAKALERETKKQEKEAKKQEQAELKAKRDEEKHERDVEKRKKAEEREVKRREKELEEERKTQEKLKKERAQMRLGAFFQAPPSNSSPTAVPARRRSLSLETYDSSKIGESAEVAEESVAQPVPDAKSDYRAFFLPFELKDHTSIHVAKSLPEDQLETDQQKFDSDTQGQHHGELFNLGLQSSYPDLRACFPQAARRKCRLSNVRKIHQAARNSDHSTSEQTTTGLQTVPVRYIHFSEDVRPPYVGTFTNIQSEKTAEQMRCKPFTRGRTDTNYDYDSEAEWEEPDPEGEDLDNDEEDDESVDDGNEMDEFLDDENDELVNRRRVTVSDLVPECTGICWQTSNSRQSQHGIPVTDQSLLSSLKLQILLPNFAQPSIDPFSTSYWQSTKPKEKAEETDKLEPVERPPLAERSSNTPSRPLDSAWPIQDTEQQVSKPRLKAGTQKTMSTDEFEAFKHEVVGSLLSKQELMTKLKTS